MRDLFIATKKSDVPQKQTVVFLKRNKNTKSKAVFKEPFLRIFESRLKTFLTKLA